MEIKRLKKGNEPEAIIAVKKYKSCVADKNYYQKFLANPKNHLIIAYDNGKPVGMALGYEIPRVDRNRNMLFFYEIGVDKKYRRKGIATALINELKSICRKKKILQMFVITNASNKPAMKLYQSTGGNREALDDVVFVYPEKSLG
jgi:ribosomal protein S18 acetylase RimI-like enzyme